MAIDKVTSAAITDGTITSSDLASGTIENQSAFKNIIINGDMSQAQRTTSASSLTSSGYHALDRFNNGINSQGTWTISQDTTVPTGQGFAKSLKYDCTTADGSPASGDYVWLEQKIEGQNLQYLKKGTSSAESVTISFWVYATKTGTNILELLDKDNTRHICQSYTISSSNTWEKKEITFAGDTTGAFNNDNGESASLLFWLGAGSNYTSGSLATSWASYSGAATTRAVGQVNHADSTSNNFYITGIQMESGTSASDFEFLPFDVNRFRCFRYYQIWCQGNNKTIGTASMYNSTSLRWLDRLDTPLRTTPTLEKTSGTDYYKFFRDGTAVTFDDISLNDTYTESTFQVYATVPSSTAGQAGMFRAHNSSTKIAFSAEL